MRLTISLEARFYRTPDQRVWTESVPDYSFWHRYLEVFDNVVVVARVQDVTEVPERYRRTDGPGVAFVALPCYIGPYQYLSKAWRIETIARAAVGKAEAFLLRSPGQISSRMFRHLEKKGHPYGVEVVGDPYDVFAPGSVDHPFRPYFRWQGVRQLKKQCRGAVAASYVTEHTLQQRYPNSSHSVGISDVEISGDDISPPRTRFGRDGVFSIAFVGSLAQLYKAPDILIEAVALCRSRGIDLRLRMIGDGRFRAQIEEQARGLGLAEVVTFVGQVPAGKAVRNELMQADLFILPSRTEGLPRALVEAMACGLPCLGSRVGGIPELLPAEDLVTPGDAAALADKIAEVVESPQRLRDMSATNLRRAQGFRNDILDQRRRDFYRFLHDRTQGWIEGRKGRS